MANNKVKNSVEQLSANANAENESMQSTYNQSVYSLDQLAEQAAATEGAGQAVASVQQENLE